MQHGKAMGQLGSTGEAEQMNRPWIAACVIEDPLDQCDQRLVGRDFAFGGKHLLELAEAILFKNRSDERPSVPLRCCGEPRRQLGSIAGNSVQKNERAARQTICATAHIIVRHRDLVRSDEGDLVRANRL